LTPTPGTTGVLFLHGPVRRLGKRRIEVAFLIQAHSPRTARSSFTILTVGDRFSDKGVLEAIDAYQILRGRHGEAVRIPLVCARRSAVNAGLPPEYVLPEGVTLYDSTMSDDVKAAFYQAADVFVLPNYRDTVMTFVEAAAFGVPAITARIHHDDAFVRHGVTGTYSRHRCLPTPTDGAPAGEAWMSGWPMSPGVESGETFVRSSRTLSIGSRA
jgi:glycosyltransferase involved in cell wall biosynthesis